MEPHRLASCCRRVSLMTPMGRRRVRECQERNAGTQTRCSGVLKMK